MLTRRFFNRPTVEVAKRLLGMKVCTRVGGRITSGMIVEVEAYHERGDRASHSYPGKTARNEVMFRAGGHCYVYVIYGMHHCLNVVTEDEGIGAAVLIRAVEPLEGEDLMRRRRGVSGRALTSGPGKLCQALGVDLRMNGEFLLNSKKIWLEDYRGVRSDQIASSRRVGISKSIRLPWRFYFKDSSWLSRA